MAFEIDSPVTGVKDGHFENKAIGIGIGENPTCPVVCPAPISSGTVSAVSIDRIDMSCSNCTAQTGLTAEIVDLGTSAMIEDISIHAVGQSVVNTLITTLDDHNNSCAVSDSSLAEYIVGHTGLIESSSASNCHQLATGTITDTLGNPAIIIAPSSSTNNDQITVTNAVILSGHPVSIAATGGDTNISLALTPKGTGLISANGSIVSVSSITTNSSTNLCTPSLSCIGGAESSTGPTPASGDDFIFFSSTNHCAEESYNAGLLECVPGVNGSVTAGHVAIFNSATDIKDAGFAYSAIPLNDVVSPTGSVATFANANNPIVFASAQLVGSPGQSAMTFSEASPAAGTGDNEVAISTMNTSTSIPLNISQGQVTGVSLPALNITSTWNTSSAVDALIKANVTNTASGSPSALIDLQVGSTTQFAVTSKGSASAARYVVDSSGTLTTGNFALSAGWGSGATVGITNTNSKDQAFTVTVTAGTTGLATSPTLTLTFHNGSWGNVPVYVCKMEGGSGTITNFEENPTATTLPITFLGGSPSSGATYIISCIGIGT